MAAPGLRFGMKVQNVDSTLKALRQVDPDLRRKVPNEIKSYAQPMLAEIKAGMPKEITSGWSRKGRTGYRYSSARYKTTLQFRGRPPRAGTFVTPNGRKFTVKPGTFGRLSESAPVTWRSSSPRPPAKATPHRVKHLYRN